MFPRGSGAEDAATSVLGALEAEPGPREPREATARGGRLIQVQPHHPRGSGGGKRSAPAPATFGSLRETLPPQARLRAPGGTLLRPGPRLSGSLKEGSGSLRGRFSRPPRALAVSLAGTAAGSQELGPYSTLATEISSKSSRGVSGCRRVPGSPWQRGWGWGCAPGFPSGIC